MGDSQNREFSETAARELAQIVGQAVSQAMLKAQSTTQGSSQESKQEEIMGGEAIRAGVVQAEGMRGLNSKLHYDEHASLLAELHQDSRRLIAQEQTYVAELRRDARETMKTLGILGNIAIKGALASDALITKGAIFARDVMVDATVVPGPGEEPSEAGGE